jgi:hypothetical protein
MVRVIKPFQGIQRLLDIFPGLEYQPWALGYNAFGVMNTSKADFNGVALALLWSTVPLGSGKFLITASNYRKSLPPSNAKARPPGPLPATSSPQKPELQARLAAMLGPALACAGDKIRT